MKRTWPILFTATAAPDAPKETKDKELVGAR